MILRFEHILNRIRQIDKEIGELKFLRSKIPNHRLYSGELQFAFDKQINILLNEKILLEDLEIEDPPEEFNADMISVDTATSTRIRADHEAKEKRLTQKEKKIREFIRLSPKTEVHLHLEACISKDTLIGMLENNNQPYDPEKVKALYKFTNLQEFITLFLFILDAIKSPDDFNLIFKNLRNYLEKNSIRYAEVFYAPSKMIQNGLHYNEIAQTLDILSRECRLDGGPDVRFLVDVSRTFGPENAEKNLDLVLSSKNTSTIGIGLGGVELKGPAAEFRDVFARAHAEGLHAVAHAGEDDGPWSVRDAVEILKAERIGHGTSAIQDPSLVEALREKEIPIEICLTSNLFTGKYVREEKNHPVRQYYENGLMLCINTDDPEIFNVDLTDEFFKLYRHLNFSVSEIIDLIRQGVYASFHPNPQKLWSSYEKEIDEIRTRLSL